ncbi:MAG TPA: hypothetical protein VFQ35_06525 [Polyangiaceae bacterium]|nr:hypothetical protein [Polyangiaceae bacterium]
MPVARKRALELALSLENASSYPHFDRVAVRTPRRTFATFALRGDDVNFAFDLALQEQFCSLAPDAISPVPGGWGRMGWTSCDLSKVDAATFKAALLAAHARSNVPRGKRTRSAIAKPAAPESKASSREPEPTLSKASRGNKLESPRAKAKAPKAVSSESPRAKAKAPKAVTSESSRGEGKAPRKAASSESPRAKAKAPEQR